MIGVYVTVPIACFRKGLAREYLETEQLPPPSTCYGFLLSLVGETNRRRHIGCSVTPVLLNSPELSVVLRTVWRVKKTPLGSDGNTRPDYQQLLSLVELLIWLHGSGDRDDANPLEQRVARALRHPAGISRFGGLSLGESTHLVDVVSPFEGRLVDRFREKRGRAFLLAESGRLMLPVWADHVGSANTRYATGDMVESSLSPPPVDRMAVIQP